MTRTLYLNTNLTSICFQDLKYTGSEVITSLFHGYSASTTISPNPNSTWKYRPMGKRHHRHFTAFYRYDPVFRKRKICREDHQNKRKTAVEFRNGIYLTVQLSPW